MKRVSILVLVLIVFVWAQQSRPQENEESRSSKVPTNFIVVDSTGKTVGPVIGVSEVHSAVVAFSLEGKLLPVEVFRTIFFRGTLFFTSADCTGQPFQDVSWSPFPASMVSGPGNTLYTADGQVQSIVSHSNANDPRNCFANEPQPLSDAVPLKPVFNLDVFTPPFNVVSSVRKDRVGEE
jgi:hypothetical protein